MPPSDDPPADGLRLNRVLAQAGVASRRRADELIASGRVAVDGLVVREPGRRVAAGERVTLDGDVLRREPPAYILLNKPEGVVTTARDPQGRRTVLDLVRTRLRVFPVGRLDAGTTGLLLLTNDGDLAQRLAHPRHGVEKTYRATIAGELTPAQAERLRRGVELDDGPTAPARVRVLHAGAQGSVLELTIHEGRNRQVRRMLEAVGHRVRALERVAYGPLRLGDLARGASRPLSAEELRLLRGGGGSAASPPRRTGGRGHRPSVYSPRGP